MPVERRGQQNLNRDDCSQTDRSIRYPETRGLPLNSSTRIRLHANKGGKEATFCHLFSHFNVENSREAFRALDGSTAKGMGKTADGQHMQLCTNLNHILKSPLREIRTAGSARVLLNEQSKQIFRINSVYTKSIWAGRTDF